LPRGRNSILDTLVTCHVINLPLPNFLNELLAPFPLRDSIQGKDIFILWRSTLTSLSGAQPESRPMTIYGEVKDEHGVAVANATIELKGGNLQTTADADGRFVLSKVRKGDIVIAGSINTNSLEKIVESPDTLRFLLKQKIKVMPEFVLENGYQRINKQMNVGSTGTVDNFLFNRNPSSSVLDRIENTVPGILFNKGGQGADGNTISDLIQIRGRSTLFANAAPLIVLNNFPYDGDLRNINPNDVDTVFVLKDAAATSIWGARAGNGVIIIATKKGKDGLPQAVYNTSIGFQQRPDFFDVHAISSTDFLAFEKMLFDNGYYTPNFTDPNNYAPVTPGVGLLYAAQQDPSSHQALDAERTALGQHDVRKDISKYLYRNSINQQHSLQLSGNANSINYYLSASWDHNLSNVATTTYDRITLRSQNSLSLTRSLQVDAGINFTKITDRNGGNIQYNYQSPVS
ncbi:MAG: TonB-dependent receptor plug domain-containing protein, partial [Bacteroidota bacterium]